MSSILQGASFRTVYARLNGSLPENTLACVQFGLNLHAPTDPRQIVVGLDRMEPTPFAELWLSDRPVQHGHADGFNYACNGEVLFGSLRLDESELRELDRATLKAYVHVESFLRQRGYPCWLRMWNFLSRINEGEGDHERYRQFSAGRHRALALKPGFEQELPAATAIGMLEPGLLIYFLAGKHAGIQVENPRQLSAFRYPRQYGPKSPCFSRARLLPAADGARLLVSGTASVVGHASVHVGDPVAQLRETAANIDALLAHALATYCPGADRNAAQAESLKLYLRDAAHFPLLRPHIARLFGADTPMLHLRGDICRDDLLLEIEGVYALPGTPARNRVDGG